MLCVFVAGLANLAVQEGVFWLTTNLFMAIILGLAVGTLIKYTTNKKYVFKYVSESNKEEAKNFLVYGLFGAAAAALFIVIEYSIAKSINHVYSRQIGALVAILITSYLKFLADKKYVFNKN